MAANETYAEWAGWEETEQEEALCTWIDHYGMDALRRMDSVTWEEVRRDGCPWCARAHVEDIESPTVGNEVI